MTDLALSRPARRPARRPTFEPGAFERWAPLFLLPALALPLRAVLPAWAFMWLLAVAVFAGCKWLMWSSAPAELRAGRTGRSLGYFFLWPGLEPRDFLDLGKRVDPPTTGEWLGAAAKTALGVAILWLVVPRVPGDLLAGWLGMAGIVLVLHFGGFHLLSAAWRSVGVAADPIMGNCITAPSLSVFWAQRWNRAFHSLAVRNVMRPARRVVGIRVAILSVFLVSGLVHDFVISVPAGAAYGLPTLYFLIQGVGVVTERSRLGARLHLRDGLPGWSFMAAVTVLPVGLAFHPPFVHEVVLPFLAAIGAR